ncbi:hypothetical protein WJX77_003102 [Trebouxia sp. C0004]
MQCEWDPEDKSLVFDFKITGKPAPNHTHVVYKRGTISNEFLNRPLEEVSILEQTLYGAGTSRLPQLCYLEGRALPEEYFFGIASTAMHQPTRLRSSPAEDSGSSQQRPANRARAVAPQGLSPAVLLGNSRQRSGTTRLVLTSARYQSGSSIFTAIPSWQGFLKSAQVFDRATIQGIRFSTTKTEGKKKARESVVLMSDNHNIWAGQVRFFLSHTPPGGGSHLLRSHFDGALLDSVSIKATHASSKRS